MGLADGVMIVVLIINRCLDCHFISIVFAFLGVNGIINCLVAAVSARE